MSKTNVKSKLSKSSNLNIALSKEAVGGPSPKKPVNLEDESDQKGVSLSFQILSQDVSKELMELDVDDMQRKIIEIFKLNSWVTDLQEAALADYYTGAVWWAKEQGFNDQQMSAFFTAAYNLLENVKVKHMTVVDNMRELKCMLTGIGTEPSADVAAGGLECLDVAQGKAVTKYIVTSLFQHYKLYEFMFNTTSNKQAQEIIGHDVQIVVPKAASVPFPPPLDEGIEEEKLSLYIKAPAALATEEEVSKAEKAEDKEFPGIDLESDIFSQLTAQDVQEVVESVAAEMLQGLQHEVAVKLHEKESAILAKINKIQSHSSK